MTVKKRGATVKKAGTVKKDGGKKREMAVKKGLEIFAIIYGGFAS